ncbi:hypothetical protein [Paenarthrobacter sp. A20]|uniref:hypothetical protein n=1 Tax=Paenarthrobacter sp. A20 TaxID=2817891 RepID=UPI0020A0843D|nr:hypothetical protein [Paenarthrobacter sp. A20]MCP1414423.1 hypothetical protein [Paenarthrobacter sp. A20]
MISLPEDELPEFVLTDEELSYYVKEVTLQARSVRLAGYQYKTELEAARSAENIIVAAQSVINAAMAINRLLWPGGISKRANAKQKLRHAWSVQRSEQLREVLGNPDKDTSPLGDRDVRNAFEHFEEYLDQFLMEVRAGTKPTIAGDMNVGPRSGMRNGRDPVPQLRFVDNQTNEVSVLDRSLALQPLFDAVDDADIRAKRWLTQLQRKSLSHFAAAALEDSARRRDTLTPLEIPDPVRYQRRAF